ncbi:hypothetical protein ACFU93_04760 [Streptomyces sp. NPDC057611]|uniref:hypothetical protein n=1 Tax=Streptomyces sp. NPDC057611 TaxID=3346182 RepID=UPI0036AB8867
MTTPLQEPSPQLGLLDLSVDLSVPEVYSGTDFTLYLHIKNPFSIPVWIQSVELSLPTQLLWRSPGEEKKGKSQSKAAQEAIWRSIVRRNVRIGMIGEDLASLPENESEERSRLRAILKQLEAENDRDHATIASAPGHVSLQADDESVINVYDPQAENIVLKASSSSIINVYGLRSTEGAERVPLTGSLPQNTALEPGCTDVWTIRLGTGKSPFFIPAKYHLQLTVIYGLEPPRDSVSTSKRDSGADRSALPARRLFSNTTSFTAPVKAALWSVMLGGVVGGGIGSVGRSLQEAKGIDVLALGPSLGALLLAVILSGAAIIFSARKSDAQSFVTIEDFWGGLLVGFFIGYSGTAAFTEITQLKA